MEQLSAKYSDSQHEIKHLAATVRSFLGKYQTALQTAYEEGARTQKENWEDYPPVVKLRQHN